MATYVNRYANSGSAGSTTLTVGSVVVQAGDAIVVSGGHEDNTSATISFSDNAAGGSNTYGTVTQSNRGSVISCRQGYVLSAKASETLTITVTYSTSVVYREANVFVFRPAASTTFAFDKSSTANGDGTAMSAGTIAPAGVGGAAVAVFKTYNTRNYTPGTGWTEGGGDGTSAYDERRILTTETSITGDATQGSTADNQWTGSVLALKEEAAATTTSLVIPSRAAIQSILAR